jgi:hypothetical protein
VLEKLERIEERMRKESSLMTWLIATCAGAFFNLIVINLVAIFYQAYLGVPIEASSLGAVLVIGMFALILPILYSVIVSHLIERKLFVSPFMIIILTSVLILFQVLVSLRPLYTTTSFNILLQVLFGIIYLGLFGYVGEKVTRSIVGLGDMGTHQHTIRVSEPFNEVKSLVHRKFALRDALGLTEKTTSANGKIIIYRSRLSGYQFHLVIVGDPNEPTKTLLHFEGYAIGRYYIGTTDQSEIVFERDVQYFEKVLKENGLTPEPSKYGRDFPFANAIDQVILAPTGSKLVSVSALPWQTVAVLIGVSILVGIVFVLRANQTLSQNDFVSGLLLGIGPLIITVLQFFRGPAKRKWTED